MDQLHATIEEFAAEGLHHVECQCPFHQPDGTITQVREACGAGMHMINGVCRTTAARRQARRGLVWDAGHVGRKWG